MCEEGISILLIDGILVEDFLRTSLRAANVIVQSAS